MTWPWLIASWIVVPRPCEPIAPIRGELDPILVRHGDSRQAWRLSLCGSHATSSDAPWVAAGGELKCVSLDGIALALVLDVLGL
jgi:hypothetical protein